MWVTVYEPRSGETLLQRRLTPLEMRDDNFSELSFALEACEGLGEGAMQNLFDPEEATDFPHLADIVVTFYLRKKDINGGALWTQHGFYYKR